MACATVLEDIARGIRLRARFPVTTAFVDVVTLAERHFGPHAITEDATLSRDACVRRCRDGGYQVILRSSWNVRLPIAVAIARHEMRSMPFSFAERDLASTRVGRAILASPEAVQACRDRGMRLGALCAAFGLSRSVIATRLSELGRPPIVRARFTSPIAKAV